MNEIFLWENENLFSNVVSCRNESIKINEFKANVLSIVICCRKRDSVFVLVLEPFVSFTLGMSEFLASTSEN